MKSWLTFPRSVNVDWSGESNEEKTMQWRPTASALPRHTYGIGWWEQSPDDDERQELCESFLCSRCCLESSVFSSSGVTAGAGKRNGGGGNFFDRAWALVPLLVVGARISIDFVSTDVRLLIFLRVTSKTSEKKTEGKKRRRKEREGEKKTSWRQRQTFSSPSSRTSHPK